MNFGGSGKPKKTMVAAKPPGARGERDRAQVDLAKLGSAPTGRALLLVLLLAGIAVVALLVPRALTLVSRPSIEHKMHARLARYRLRGDSDYAGLYRATTKRTDHAMDPRATLYGSLVAGPSAPMSDDAIENARAQFKDASGLGATSIWTRVLCALGECPSNCATRCLNFYNSSEGMFRESAVFPPTLRAQLAGVECLSSCGGGNTESHASVMVGGCKVDKITSYPRWRISCTNGYACYSNGNMESSTNSQHCWACCFCCCFCCIIIDIQ